jgi:hypothetical protein
MVYPAFLVGGTVGGTVGGMWELEDVVLRIEGSFAWQRSFADG